MKRVIAALLLVVLALVVLAITVDGRRRLHKRPADDGRVPMGVLGDSDSAVYHNRVGFSDPATAPGGPFHAITFQWPEVVAQLRADRIDPGERAVWGVPRVLSMARLRDGLGLRWRAPRADTFQYNLAWASGCEALNDGPWRQAPRLAEVMDENPARWQRGFVVIRSGVNSFGHEARLEALARNADDPAVNAIIDECIGHLKRAVQTLHARHPQTRIVLVGIFDNTNWQPLFERWQSAQEIANIRRGLDRFDRALREWAASDPRLAFFDDRAWFAGLWGERDPQTGRPAYRDVRVGPLTVSNTAGDRPEHAILQNMHAGLAWNLLWSQRLVALVRERFALPVEPIRDDEIDAYLQRALAQAGYRP